MASKRHVRQHACGTKQRFASLDAALRAVHALQLREPQRSASMTPYHCGFCGQYHYGRTAHHHTRRSR